MTRPIEPLEPLAPLDPSGLISGPVPAAAPALAPGEAPSGVAAPADPAVPLPELAVQPHVLVVPLPTDREVSGIVQEWCEIDPELAEYEPDVEGIVAAACGESEQGEVAVFLSYRADGDGLLGGAALLTLELLDPMPGSPHERAELLAEQLRRSADRMGHVEGVAEVAVRRTSSGVPATRLRFFTVLSPVADVVGTPMVEACRWLFPAPGHPDLAWSLLYQTTDLTAADELVGEFDRLAGSLGWTEPGHE